MSKGSNTKQTILDAAEYEFVNNSFGSAHTVNIAKRAGVTHAMLHYYFRTKEQLFETVLETKVSSMSRVLHFALEDTNEDFTTRFMRTVSSHFDFFAKNQNLCHFVLGVVNEESPFLPLLSKMMNRVKTKVMEGLKVEVQEAIDKGEIKEVDVASLMLDTIQFNMSAVFFYKKMQLLNINFYDSYEAYCAARKAEIMGLIRLRLKKDN